MNALTVLMETHSASDHKNKAGEPHSCRPLTLSSHRSTVLAVVADTQDVFAENPYLRPWH
jgi:hypothetical protein